ncbi:unnamed protein product [Paramecium sonneborni]|uniref:Uncharacterized protein n=1 Tax=Paramecium sonneborni TaxID=65129 RepID=A0A8S1MYG8_9CILI|nr:unnamed protein product [Paramecium sonneborni]
MVSSEENYIWYGVSQMQLLSFSRYFKDLVIRSNVQIILRNSLSDQKLSCCKERKQMSEKFHNLINNIIMFIIMNSNLCSFPEVAINQILYGRLNKISCQGQVLDHYLGKKQYVNLQFQYYVLIDDIYDMKKINYFFKQYNNYRYQELCQVINQSFPNQFKIWVKIYLGSGSKEIDRLFVFELKKGSFIRIGRRQFNQQEIAQLLMNKNFQCFIIKRGI